MTHKEASEELPEAIERILRFNCPNGCDGQGSYPEMTPDEEVEQGQCQWCFEFGMPAREAIHSYANEARIDELKAMRETLNPFKGEHGYDEFRDRIAELEKSS